MPKEDNEAVNGPRIAAEILKRLPNAARERLVQAIHASSPEIGIQVQQNLLSFEDLLEVTPQGIQFLVQEVEHMDLVLSLKTVTPEVKEVLLSNMSERKSRLVVDDLASLPPTKLSEVENAQQRILQKFDELRTTGQIRTRGKNDVWV